MEKHLDRRAVHDRRTAEGEPPAGWKERRRSVERRIPELLEDEITELEWVVYFARWKMGAQNGKSSRN